MKNVYLVQPNYKGGFGKYTSFWIPYSVGSLWAYASQDPRISENFSLKGLMFQRTAVETVIAGMEDPCIVGFSNYIWNVNYNRSLAQAIKSRWPGATIVFGGPEVPDRIDSFFTTHPYVDIAVHQEGEIAFQRILLEHLAEPCDITGIPGISFVHPMDGATRNPSKGRIQDLDVLPSPYLTGVFDDIIRDNDVQWAATFETNRGCPFKCHFCDWGSLTFSKVKKFGSDRVTDELEWFGDNKVEYIFVADANFGAFKKRDYAIADHLVDVSQRKGYPKNANIQWAKNSNQDVVELAAKLGSIQKGMTLSVQSMTEEVLTAIERQNMAISNLSDILDACNEKGIPSYTELILGLPCETFESWQENWHKLLDLGQHCSIELWIAQLLENSALNDPLERARYGIESVKAKNYFFGISDTADPAESKIDEEILLVRATTSMPSDALVESYMYGWMIVNFHLFGWTQLCARFLNKHSDRAYGDFYRSLFECVRDDNGPAFIHAQYKDTREKITEFLTGGDISVNLKSEIGLDMKFVGHNLLYKSQIVFRCNPQEVFSDLGPFLSDALDGLMPSLGAALRETQENSVTRYGTEYPQAFHTDWNIGDYVLRDAELLRGRTEWVANHTQELLAATPHISTQSKEEFLNMLLLKRRLGAGTLAITPGRGEMATATGETALLMVSG